MRTQIEEMVEIIHLLNIQTLKGYRDIEGISTGSSFKSKDEIVNTATGKARKARRLTSTLTDCLMWVGQGKTIQDFYNHKLEQSTRTNQCEQDRLDSMEELEMFTDLIIEI